MGIHEIQSRFFENTVGRPRAFMGPLLQLLRRHAPEPVRNACGGPLDATLYCDHLVSKFSEPYNL